MNYNEDVKLGQAVTMVIERARLALSLAASSGRTVTAILKHEDGQITFAVTLDGER